MLRLASWNLRYDSSPDNISIEESLQSLPSPLQPPAFRNVSGGERPWSSRRIQVARTILHEDTHIIGFQEALVRQVEDLWNLMGEGTWSYVGVGREDGKREGEYSPIFYKHLEFHLISTDTFWLSHTPFKPSKFPGAGSTRICTVAKLSRNNGVGGPIVVLNSHLDNASDDQRKFGASMILVRARFEAAASEGLIFLSGDFNSSATGNDDSAYKIITGALPPVTINEEFARQYKVPDSKLPKFCMIDIRTKTNPLNISGNFATYTSFKNPENSSSDTERIDFIFGGSNGGWVSESYAVPSALSDDGMLASDHRPVFVHLSQN